MSRLLKLEDLKWEGTNSRRLLCRNRTNTVMKFMNPVIDFDEFQFTLKIRSCQGYEINSELILKTLIIIQNERFGSHGGIGWGWCRGLGVFGTGYKNEPLNATYHNEDLVTISVNRNTSSIEFLKNRKSAGKLENLEFPKNLVIAVGHGLLCSFEVIEFSCKPKAPPLPTKEETMEKRIMSIQMQMERKYEKLEEAMKLMRIIQEEKDNMIVELQKNNEELNLRNEELVKEIQDLKEKFDTHFENFHRTKYTLKSSTSPQMTRRTDQIYYCYENEVYRYNLDFSIQNDHQNTRINFKELRITHNSTPFYQYKVVNNSIEFRIRFTKIGRNELTCLFGNIRHTFKIDVEPTSLCCAKCELLFYAAMIEPTGPPTRLSNQPTDTFTSENTIQVVIKLVNENGMPMKPKFLEEEELRIMLLKTESDGGKKKMKKIQALSRDNGVKIGEIDSKGEFCVCLIEERKLDCGSFLVKIDGVEIGLKEVFRIV